MPDASTRFGIPFIIPGQAQKEAYHNEALNLIDAALHPSVEAGPMDNPPASPVEGQSWLVGETPQAAWSGKTDTLASWTSGGWRFLAPVPGMIVWSRSSDHWLYWTGSGWSDGELPASRIVIGGAQVVGPRLPDVPTPSGGTVIDQEARTTIGTIIATLKSHGLIE